MSWFVSGIVTDGNTTDLEEKIANSNSGYVGGVNEDMKDQQAFALDVVQEAFSEGVVDGTYNVTLNGHSNPDQENDRKSLGISFSPITAPVAESEVVS